jgi:hypothetical protein
LTLLPFANLHIVIPANLSVLSPLLPAAICIISYNSNLQSSTGEMRARMGEVAHQRSDFVIVTNSSPRLEDPADIIQVRSRCKKKDVCGWLLQDM